LSKKTSKMGIFSRPLMTMIRLILRTKF